MSEHSSKPIRSPSYPSMSLRDAVDAVAKIEGQYRASPVDRTVAAKLIGYSALSGPANKALAALASYGLVERAGKGETRVTSRARAIIHADNDKERIENLLAAASEPDLFRELRERFEGIPVPPEDGVVTYLNRQGFNPSAVGPAAKAFLQTMAYVEELGVNESHGNQSSAGAESKASNGGDDDVVTYGGAKVGDFIQWELQGALQFKQPQRVRAIDSGGEWLFVDGSTTGIPMNEVIVEQSHGGEQPQRQRPPEMPLPPADNRSSEPGESEWMRNKVGPDSVIRIMAKGEMGPKEIGKLIKLLEAQKMVLEDD